MFSCCRSCVAPYHSGMSCEFYQVYKCDDDHSLKVGDYTSHFSTQSLVVISFVKVMYSMCSGVDGVRCAKPETLPHLPVAH